MPRRSAAMADLFAEPAQHDPGGKVKTALPPGMYGSAEFYGARHEYRLTLYRDWDGASADDLCVVFVGMNPSVADVEGNDPTVTRDIGFAKSFGFKRYWKLNICDFRATYPTDLVKPFVIPRSDKNLDTIRHICKGAAQIIMCYGVMHKPLQHYAFETVRALEADGHRLWCLGTTLHGHPRHSLYLRADTKPEPFIYAEPPHKTKLQKGAP